MAGLRKALLTLLAISLLPAAPFAQAICGMVCSQHEEHANCPGEESRQTAQTNSQDQKQAKMPECEGLARGGSDQIRQSAFEGSSLCSAADCRGSRDFVEADRDVPRTEGLAQSIAHSEPSHSEPVPSELGRVSRILSDSVPPLAERSFVTIYFASASTLYVSTTVRRI